MNDTVRALLILLECAIHDRAPSVLPDMIDWAELVRLAAEHRIDGLLLSPILALPPDKQPPRETLSMLQQRAMATTMRQFQMVDTLHHTLAALDEAGVRAVVLKGILLKMLYPQPDLRVMSDADLLVAPSSFVKAKTVLNNAGFVEVPDDSHEDTYVCLHEDGLRIELHNRMFDKKSRGFLARLDEDALFPVSKAVRMPGYGGECWTMPVSLHALFQLLHMAKHMITTGFGLRQVCDFALFISAHENAIDWSYLHKQCEALELMPFTRALIKLCAKYLSLGTGSWRIMIAHESPPDDDQAAERLLADILDAGVFGKSTAERVRSAALVYRSFDGKTSESRARTLLRAIFIRRAELHPPYMYAKRLPILLPAAWAHRLLRYLFVERRQGAESGAGIFVARERMALLDQLGMLK